MVYCCLQNLNLIIGGGSPLGIYLKHVILDDIISCGLSGINDIKFDLTDINSWGKIIDFVNSLEYTNLFIYFIGYSSHIENKKEYPEVLFLRWLSLNLAGEVNKYIILTSTMAVYSNKNEKNIEETSLIEPFTPYGCMKRSLELEVYSLVNNKIISSALILRIPCLVGPNAKHNFLVTARSSFMSGLNISLSNIEAKFNSVTDFSEVNYVINRWKFNYTKGLVSIYNLAGNASCTLKEFFAEIGVIITERTDKWPVPSRIMIVDKIISDGYEISDTKTILWRFF
jgi:dTDP-4-dehydrorhamnose reductase